MFVKTVVGTIIFLTNRRLERANFSFIVKLAVCGACVARLLAAVLCTLYSSNTTEWDLAAIMWNGPRLCDINIFIRSCYDVVGKAVIRFW